ncbi:MAG: cell cycle transcriptional regulator TrcR [Pseudomonadota bacterium]
MARPLMPKATAVWLIENTSLSFDQIADYCGLHALEIQAIADGEVAGGMHGINPVAAGDLTVDEIERCQKNPAARLKAEKPTIPQPKARPKGARYTPVAKRQERPDAIAWLLKNYPELGDGQISRLLGTTKSTIASIRDRSHWNAPNIKPQNPVNLGLCSSADLEKAIALARTRIRNAQARADKAARLAAADAAAAAAAETPAPEDEKDGPSGSSGTTG